MERHISERGFLLPISSSRSQGVPMLAPSCKLVRDASDWLRVPCLTGILCTLSKSDCMVLIMWSPFGYTPVRPECPDIRSSSCLLIKRWQITKAHGVTRNEPKIHAICYITISSLVLITTQLSCPTRASYSVFSVINAGWNIYAGSAIAILKAKSKGSNNSCFTLAKHLLVWFGFMAYQPLLVI